MTNPGRPAGDPVEWATDAAWSDPGEDWDGEPPQADPSALAPQGFKPNLPIAADHANYLFAKGGDWARYLDLVDAKNYPHGATITTAAGNLTGEACALTWSGSQRLLFVPGGTGTSFGEVAYSSYDDGINWATELTSSGNEVVSCCTRMRNETTPTDLASAILINLSTNTVSIATRGSSGGAWVTTALTNSLKASRVVPDEIQGGFWVLGNVAADEPAVWRFVDTGGGASFTQANYSSGTVTDMPDCIAVGRGRLLFANWDTSIARIWTKNTGVGAVSTVTHPGTNTERVMDLLWVDVLGMFVMLVESAGTTKVYRSTLGTTGTWSGPVVLPYSVNKVAGGAVRGSVLVVPVNAGGNTALAISTDGGISWEYIADPTVRNGATTKVMRIADQRWIALGYTGSGFIHKFALGLRTGRA